LAEQIEAQLQSVRSDYIEAAIDRIRINKLDAPWLQSNLTRKLSLSLLQAPLLQVLEALQYLAERMPTSNAILSSNYKDLSTRMGRITGRKMGCFLRQIRT